MDVGLVWFGMKLYYTQMEQKRENEEFGTLKKMGFGIGLGYLVLGTMDVFIMGPNDKIRKIVWGTGGGKNDDGLLVHSTEFSAVVCCCSLFMAGILLWLGNGVAEMVAKYRSEYLWVSYALYYSIGIFTFLSTAVVCGIRTYNLYQSRRQMPAAASASV
ncbi:hypothetical protein COLO4_03447 [Corchorus olitorius]|uniref:Uncharacterized protein n=1 Tax=Corchorus olitorius TaxID=93759 RepID=A0A1R3KYG0_9ROSI|nr:hypothetical protein COLO4_03447 [Corchorus olitorius]